ncbi:YdcF family protein [Myroides odoratimimus]|uniref:YdcF family protein n=1 Tax=Myroides odoratimimus TaxID=76832 RepID=UPI002576D414|nr:YdcF family protein [Myroides odoratimimus]MDM1468697.1 YdcF family protein [Myroides odoratimimus]MDM1472017.1 YdcF family protein [Myroides odoratimimus]MDM1482029.1 YdcF family protein [Myroides odoratimimus]
MKKKSSFIIIIFFTLYCVITSIKIYEYSSIDETQNADVAIVLGAGIWNKEPSPVFKERINHSIQLYKKGYVKKIIYTGGKADGKNFSESYVAKSYAEKLGVKSEDILIEEKSKITKENLEFAKVVMLNNNLNKALIVSDPLHMKRSILLAKDMNIDAYTSPTKTSRYKSTKNKMKFLSRETFFYITYQIYRVFN